MNAPPRENTSLESTESSPKVASDKLVQTRPEKKGGGLVYNPLIRPSGQARYEIRGQLEDKSLIAWGFWGGLLVFVVTVLLILSAQSVYNVWDILWALVALSFGVFLYRYGRKSSLREEVLCEVDIERQQLAWPTAPGAGELALPFEEITEVVFGMTDYPLSESRSDVHVHAFTLLVRDADDRLIPIVEATPNKEEAHTIAKILGNELQMHISYVGKGIQ
ncbi:hypothetical protein [Persicimonas caeni]|uniref:hypothetical protein n=1 Tax=Persicimonas caeni TaxID=2292766 RepID=UPI00143CE3C0|nr:hypothetical protein [Persicimonas caeni]